MQMWVSRRRRRRLRPRAENLLFSSWRKISPAYDYIMSRARRRWKDSWPRSRAPGKNVWRQFSNFREAVWGKTKTKFSPAPHQILRLNKSGDWQRIQNSWARKDVRTEGYLHTKRLPPETIGLDLPTLTWNGMNQNKGSWDGGLIGKNFSFGSFWLFHVWPEKVSKPKRWIIFRVFRQVCRTRYSGVLIQLQFGLGDFEIILSLCKISVLEHFGMMTI